LSENDKKFSFNDFMTISKDQNDGPDNSIWRTGSSLKEERTLSSWIIAFPQNDAPVLYVTLANPGEPVKKSTYKIDESLWKKK
jgi:isopenicillin-N N-acyltransferase like protein